MKLRKNLFYNLKIITTGVFIFLLYGQIAYAALINATGLVGQTSGGNPVYTTAVVHNGQGGPTAIGFNVSNGSTIDPLNHRLFVGDSSNSRVLVFPLDSQNRISSTTASYVLGQANFTATGANLTQSGFGTFIPAMTYDTVNNRLFVLDGYPRRRVMVFDLSSGITNGMNASYVIGQANFTANVSAITQNGLASPDGVSYDAIHNRLFVTDQFNSRLLVYDLNSIANGMNASYVLGQANFTSGTAATTQSRLNNPTGVMYDPIDDRVFVNDWFNNRVMVWNVASSTITNGMNASYVIGQANFTSSTATTTQSGLSGPDDALGFDPATQRLFVSDNTNIRVMIYDVSSSTIANGMNAQNVLFQSNYTSSTTGTTQSLIKHPNGTSSYDPDTNRLFLKDRTNYRIMEFSMIHITTSSLPDGAVGSPYSQTIAIEAAQGTSQTFSVYSGSLPTGLSLDTATGAITGTPTVPATSNFTVKAEDNFSTGPLYDVVSYSLTINDITAPSISVTAPADGATASSSSVTISANASDDIGVVGVQFKVDGNNVGSEDTVSAYSINWDSTSVADGSHTITAVARDAAANSTTSSGVTVTVDNTAPVVTFSITATSDSLTVPFTHFSATDTNSVTGYLVNESAITPTIENTGWAGTAQTQYVFTTEGTKTLYAWAKDGAGHISASGSGSITIALPTPIMSRSGGRIAGWNSLPNSTTPNVISTKPNLPIDSTKNALSPLPNLTAVIFTKPLSSGMSSDDVRRLQTLLTTKPEIYPEGLITGYFGRLTKKAVQTFQLKYKVVGSKSDVGFGFVGPKTRAKLQEVFGNNN